MYLACILLIVFTLQGCGSSNKPGPSPGPSPGPKPTPPPGCSDQQIAEKCVKCKPDKTHICEACASGYGLAGNSCIANCLLPNYTKPKPPPYGIYNGIEWAEECINSTEEHFFGIGDWGGVTPGIPAPNFSPGRAACCGSACSKADYEKCDIDGHAQSLVAKVFNQQAEISKPKWVMNVGDNFYWGGIDDRHCGDFVADPSSSCKHIRFSQFFNSLYQNDALKDAPWFTVMGNHDWGGYTYKTGWDAQFYYTFCPGTGSDGYNRWRMPAPYWKQKVQFKDFSIDFFMIDSNVNDANMPPGDPNHNICQDKQHPFPQPGDACKVPNATIPNQAGCFHYLTGLWNDGLAWMKDGLEKSTADWRIVMTHFPPYYQKNTWADLMATHEIDFVIVGHVHEQKMVMPKDPQGMQVPFVITGGGGGITSEGTPDEHGQDDEYGFVDFTISRTKLHIEMFSHGGVTGKPISRRTETITPQKRTSSRKTVSEDGVASQRNTVSEDKAAYFI